MHLNQIKDSFQIEEVEVAIGCPEACVRCGAYPSFDVECLRICSIARGQVEKNLETGASFLAPRVTTTPNVEPLRIDVFADFAEVVHLRTDARSKVVAISHGLRRGSKSMGRRLERIVSLMEKQVIPLFALSMDFARSRGEIDPQLNMESYVETLIMLQTVLRVARVTVSLQAENPEAMVRVERMFAEILDKLGWSEEDLALLNIDKRDGYVASGRARDLSVDEGDDCDIIPDSEYYDLIVDEWSRDHKWRGKIDMNGKWWAQENCPGKTYGDSVGEWERVELE